jgi:hypothetical protein
MRRLKALAARLAIVTILAAAIAPTAVADSELGWSDAGAIAFDVGLLRPLSAIQTAVGVPFFVATSPFAAIAGKLGASWDVFVAAPYDYTVTRPLADF